MTRVLAEMTWPEVEAGLAETRVVLVPTASIEQHGPSLPLAVDAIRARELGRRVAAELGCFLAPTVRPGLSDHHMDFPGTISLAEDTFRAVVSDYCASLDAHGFREIALFTSHGGNCEALSAAAAAADADLDAHAFVAGTREGLMAARTEALGAFGVPPAAVGAHAGAAETAFLLATDPDLVGPTDGVAGFTGDVEEAPIERGVRAVSENGVLGDPAPATAAQGRALVETCVEYFAGEVRAGLRDAGEGGVDAGGEADGADASG